MIRFGINPARYLGLSYSKCMYPLRKDGRPMITIHLVFFVLWIKLPFKHVTDYGHGSAIESWGFVFSLKRKYAHVEKGFEYRRVL